MKVVFSIVVLWVATHFTRQTKAQATNGIISGTVTDASGAAVPGVTIQVKNVNTGVTRTVLTNEQGRYRVPDLLVGEYEVQASLAGFQTVVQRGILQPAIRARHSDRAVFSLALRFIDGAPTVADQRGQL